MTKDIVINGVSIEELKRQKQAIQKDASKIISDSIDAATAIVHQIMKAESKESALKLAEEAYEHLDTAEVVSGVSGVEYYLPYNDHGYHDGNVLTMMLEQEDVDEDEANQHVEISYRNKDALYKLYSKLESMECETRDWNASTC